MDSSVPLTIRIKKEATVVVHRIIKIVIVYSLEGFSFGTVMFI